MARRGSRKQKSTVEDVHDPDGFGVWLGRYLEALRVKNHSERTVENRDVYLRFFIQWWEERSLTKPREVTKPILERYQALRYRGDVLQALRERNLDLPSRELVSALDARLSGEGAIAQQGGVAAGAGGTAVGGNVGRRRK